MQDIHELHIRGLERQAVYGRHLVGLFDRTKHVKLSTVMFGLEELRGLFGRNARNKVKLLEVSIVKAGPDMASRLALSPGDRVILIRRLIHKEKEPILYHREYLVYDPARPIVEAEMEVTALHGLFAGPGKRAEAGRAGD